eukprot:XP_003961304.1 PREDICTED: synaptonemal complex protein SC65-like [Takifugu rubripes]
MVAFCAVLTLLCLTSAFKTDAQYENYNFRHFPAEDLIPLTAAYGLALDHYAAERWTESIKYLELSLRLYRLLRDSVRYCALRCDGSNQRGNHAGNQELRVYWHVVTIASCQKKCREYFPALQLPPPGREILQDFSKRSPYRYLHHAHSKLGDLQRAIPCAHTYLQKNPDDPDMLLVMKGYKNQYDLSGYLTDHEEQPFEACFLRGVKLLNSGNFSGGVELLEETLKLYLHEHDLCQRDCEGIVHLLPDVDFYTALSDAYINILKCKLKCEEYLMPNVGGYFVQNFVANIYHYLQYAYYKLNDGRRAAPCASSYSLFEPEDQVMEHNLMYYKAYSDQWGLQSDHFTARMEAVKLYDQTMAQKRLLALAEEYLALDDEDFFGAEEAALLASESLDVEFEGVGDYEEGIYADWSQPKGKGDTGESNI